MKQKAQRETEQTRQKESYTHTQRNRHADGYSFRQVTTEGGVKETPRSASALEMLTMLFPASRSFAVPLSARGPTLHFSNAQITQF